MISFWLSRHFKGADPSKRGDILAAAEWLLGIVATDCGAGVVTGKPDSGLYLRHAAVRRAVDGAFEALRVYVSAGLVSWGFVWRV